MRPHLTPPWPVEAITLGAFAFVLVFPILGRRDDWIGRITLAILFAAAFALWAAMARGLASRVLEWWRDRPA